MMSVHVDEAGPLAAIDVDRDLVVGRHPDHRHAVGHVGPGALEQSHRARAGLDESLELLIVDGLDFRGIDPGRRHVRCLAARPALYADFTRNSLHILWKRAMYSSTRSRT